MVRRALAFLLVAGLGLLLSRESLAAGLFVSAHGTRPLGRGGAFVAGADDLNAIFYNPAGVAAIDYGETGWSGLLDASFVLQNVAYTRDENGIMRPTVTADEGLIGSAPLFIPQFAFARKFIRPWGTMSFGFGVWIPYTGLARYPEGSYDSEANLQQVPDTSPQRYQIIGLHEGSLARAPLGAVLNPVMAFSLLKNKLLLGFGPQLLLLYVRSRIMLNGCPEIMCRPEQVDFDALAVAQAFGITPSFNLGVIGNPLAGLRLGFSFQFPFFFRSMTGTVDTRLPVNEIFNGASVEGRSARMSADIPPILRFGVEVHPFKLAASERFPGADLRIELSYAVEFWSIQKQITFTPENITIVNVHGFDRYPLGPVALRRDMLDTHTISLGIEGTIFRLFGARLGGMFETNSMPDATVTVLTPDNYKGMISFGLFIPKVRFRKTDWRFDFGYGHIIQPDRYVSPQASTIYPSNPIRPDAEMPTGIGGIGAGTYKVSYDIISLGFSAIR